MATRIIWSAYKLKFNRTNQLRVSNLSHTDNQQKNKKN